MSPLWRAELRVGLCTDRLVLARRVHRWSRQVSRSVEPVTGDPVRALSAVAANARITVILSSHLVRYAVLPWSEALTSEADWKAYARHAFDSVYGPACAANWRIQVSRSGPRAARVATAVDAHLIDSLRALPGLVSIQPYLMAAFNRRRHAIGDKTGWFVLQEQGRLTVTLVSGGEWRLIRTRQISDDWQASLPLFLERELAVSGEAACRTVMLCSEAEPPQATEGYEVQDVTLPARAGAEVRPHAMTIH